MQGQFPFVVDFTRTMPFMIPIVTVLCAFAVGIVAMLLKSRASERAHRERMFMAEKGLEIPKELYNAQEKRPSDLRGTGRAGGDNRRCAVAGRTG